MLIATSLPLFQRAYCLFIESEPHHMSETEIHTV